MFYLKPPRKTGNDRPTVTKALSTQRGRQLPNYANWTKFLMISMPDDIWWERSHRASGTNIVAGLYRVAVVSFHVVQQPDRDVA